MPTYEYRCPDGHEFEKFVQKISLASSELPCPVCGKIAERRISAGGGFVFKGSGFYITDYGKDGKKDLRANAAAASAKDGSAKSEAGSSSENSSSKSENSESSKSQSSKGENSKSESSKGESSKSESKPESAKPEPKSEKPVVAAPAPKKGSSDT